MRVLLLVVSLVAITSLLFNLKLLRERETGKISYKVIEVIDGDTFKINIGKEERRVRLIGVNAPEVGKCLAGEAKNKLAELVLGKDVTLSDQFTDPYGRIMANVYVSENYINREMLSSGFARMDYYENSKREEPKKAYQEARSRKVGIFSNICISQIPPTSLGGNICNIKGNIDENTKKKIYFLPICRNYSQVAIDLSTDDQWYCTEDEAIKAGFIKSTTCR